MYLLLVLLLLRLDLNRSAGAFGGAKFKFDSMSVILIQPSNFARFVNSISIKLSWSKIVQDRAAIIVEILTQSFKLERW